MCSCLCVLWEGFRKCFSCTDDETRSLVQSSVFVPPSPAKKYPEYHPCTQIYAPKCQVPFCQVQFNPPPSDYIPQDSREDITIINDMTIDTLRLYDCMRIIIMNCPRITAIPRFSTFVTLETLRIQHCDIPQFTHFIPDNLRTLEISYCGLKEFRPENVPNNLAELNLSFNKLKEIPRCLEHIHKKAVKINLSNNDFWFNMYSDISPGMISAGVVDELKLAYTMNLIGTSKIFVAVQALIEKDLVYEARTLKEHANLTIVIRRKHASTTAENAQNVHLTSVQDGMEAAIEYINNYTPLHNTIGIDRLSAVRHLSHDLGAKTWQAIEQLCNTNNRHSIYKMTYFEVLYKVYQIICDNPSDKPVLLAILRDELYDGIGTCFTGQITRMVNVLNGFVPAIRVGISKQEELSNAIIALRKKYSCIYPDTDEYIAETIPIIWQLLEDTCIPESEHKAWLEYV